jgi:hypothetical protein
MKRSGKLYRQHLKALAVASFAVLSVTGQAKAFGLEHSLPSHATTVTTDDDQIYQNSILNGSVFSSATEAEQNTETAQTQTSENKADSNEGATTGVVLDGTKTYTRETAEEDEQKGSVNLCSLSANFGEMNRWKKMAIDLGQTVLEKFPITGGISNLVCTGQKVYRNIEMGRNARATNIGLIGVGTAITTTLLGGWIGDGVQEVSVRVGKHLGAERKNLPEQPLTESYSKIKGLAAVAGMKLPDIEAQEPVSQEAPKVEVPDDKTVSPAIDEAKSADDESAKTANPPSDQPRKAGHRGNYKKIKAPPPATSKVISSLQPASFRHSAPQT